MADDISARLREARKYVGLSQEFVAGALGVPRSALSDMERGRRRVSTEEARKLSELYGCSLEHLVAGPNAASAAVPSQALARVTSGLSEEDNAEVARFAEFLRTRRKPAS
jgi:transcriptional regulator with XRE-family HTH domain